MRTKLASFCMLICLLAALPLTAMAQKIDHSQKGSISVTLVSPGGTQPLPNAELSVYYVATVDTTEDGRLRYFCNAPFADGGISLEDPELVAKLDVLVAGKDISSQKMITDAHGKAQCSDLSPGLYFVKQTGNVKGFAPCTSFLVTLPMETDAGYQYHVDASPKTDVARLTDITIKKVWNTGRTAGIPSSVTVQLLRDNQVVKTAVLNKQNNWQVTYKDMPESDDYKIKEVDVPQGFIATYSKNGYVFTVTNTSKLAQTGQIIWPIPVFALTGLVFLMAGFMILRKPGKQDA